jgi:hypothetical protein
MLKPGRVSRHQHTRLVTHLGELPPEAEALDHGPLRSESFAQSTKRSTKGGVFLFKGQLLGKVAGRTF